MAKHRGGRGKRRWMQKAIKRKGALHRALGVPLGQKIPMELKRWAARQPGRLGRQGRFALRAREVYLKRKRRHRG